MTLDPGTTEICGVIPGTLVITGNARLVCDVVCTNELGPGACIQFGRDNITLWLNGFTMTGPASPPTNCASTPALTPGAFDFGVGLVGTSSDNVIEDNSIGGNVNGILLFPTTARNLIRRNLIAGNPPVQLSVTFGSPVGVDIRNASPPGANTFVENHCITSEGAIGPDPCPNFPTFRGHY